MVILIWGIIIFKIIKKFNNPEIPSSSAYSFTKTNVPETVKDTFSLTLNYRDPFLDGKARFRIISGGDNNLLSEKTALATAKKASINFPEIKYSGIVINSKNKQKVGLLKIASRDFLAKEGELVGVVKISKLYNDSVTVILSNTKRTFYIK
jgi:hypothetical protein